MTPTCVNLSERFGRDYRITWDAALEEKGDPWMAQIPCRRGTIYPHGGDLLAVEIDGHNRVAEAVAALPGVTVHQWGDSERTLLFPADSFGQVAAHVKPRKRPKQTPAQLANLAKGAAYRFVTGTERTSGSADGASPEEPL